jgi:hypothetical protein
MGLKISSSDALWYSSAPLCMFGKEKGVDLMELHALFRHVHWWISFSVNRSSRRGALCRLISELEERRD